MHQQVFVARDRELAQLDEFLQRMLDSKGAVCFVTGEAGSGKTALVTEFARRAQERFPDLAVAVGQSDAQTGTENGLLPFREVLGQLTGDVETKLAQGAFTQENAGRLRKLVVLSGEALVDLGPDLIGVFVPAAGLVTRMGAFVAEKAGWLEKLERIAGKQQQDSGQEAKGIKQSQIYEQYANVLCRLSEKHPLLVIVDDLQWADAASIGLLFRLARRIENHRILVLGTYRPEEVAIGREGERHPLEKVLSELKRYYGDIWIDLNSADPDQAMRFVQAMLDTEPNHLGLDFRQKLFDHTGGHPLFTIELLRTMQERGDLVKNSRGRWVEGPGLDWDTMPDRVEGVIEERIGRLEEALRETLTVGSIEGEDFTAEVVARVRSANERAQIRRLSTELERQHRLVSGKGTRRLDASGQRLSRYRFQHNLFRTFLYRELGDAERAYLHEDVGTVLEELYGNQVEEILVQLAVHFDQAALPGKAIHYLWRAGEQAARRYANQEAERFFSRALSLLPEIDDSAGSPEKLDQRYRITQAREDVYARIGDREAQRRDLEALCRMADLVGEDRKRAEVSLLEARYAEFVGDYPSALASLDEALRSARSAHDVRLEARALRAMGFILWRKGDYKESLVPSTHALNLARDHALQDIEARALHNLSVANWRLGNLEEAVSCGERCLELSIAIGDRQTETLAHSVLGNIDLTRGELDAARAHYENFLQNEVAMGELRGQAMAQGNLGIIAELQGDYAAAMERFKRVGEIFHEIGDKNSEARAWAHQGLNANLQGMYAEGLASLEAALERYREIEDRQGQAWVLSMLSRLHATLGRLESAAVYGQEALLLAREIGTQTMEAFAWRALAHTHERNRELRDAAQAYRLGLEIHRELGDPSEVPGDLAGLARIALAQGDMEGSKELVDQVLQLSEQQSIRGGLDEPTEIFMTCYRVLRALRDPRAGPVLEKAYQIMQDQASMISEPALRRSYLENIEINREILEAYENFR